MLNPYANVNWSTIEKVVSTSHMHVLNRGHFDNAYVGGIRHFPVSNYFPSEPMYPLGDYFSNLPTDILSCPNAEHHRFSNVPVSTHINSLGSFWASGTAEEGANIPWQIAFDNIFSELQYEDGGGITINHPALSDFQEILSMLDYNAEKVLGIEVYNGTTTNKWAIDKWDAILATGRRCWGFFVPDHEHKPSPEFFGRNILLTPAITEHECLKSYRDGAFYGALVGSGLSFTGITATPTQLSVTTNSATKLTFITNQGKLEFSNTSGSISIDPSTVYARVEAEDGTGERIFSQPVMYQFGKTNKKKRIFMLMGN